MQIIDLITFSYVIMTGIFLRIFPFRIPDIVISFLALPAFLIIPCLFGKSVLRIFSSILRDFIKFLSSDCISLYVFSWMVGVYSIGIIFKLATLFRIPFLVRNMISLIIFIIALNVIYDWIKNKYIKQCFKNNVKHYLSFITIIPISIIPVLIIKTFQPFPYAIWRNIYMDPVISVQPTYRIIESGYFMPEIRWSNVIFPTITFSIFNLDPLHFLWSAPFVLAITYAFGIFILSYKISGKREVALLSVLFGLFLNIIHSLPGQFILHFKDAQIIYAMYPLLLYSIFVNINNVQDDDIHSTLRILFILILCLFIFFLCFYIIKNFIFTSPQRFQFIDAYMYLYLMIIFPLLGLIIWMFLKYNKKRNIFLLTYLYSTILLFIHKYESFLYVVAIILFIFLSSLKNNRVNNLIWMLSIFTFFYIYLQWTEMLVLPRFNIASLLLSQSSESAYTINIFKDTKTMFIFAHGKEIRLLTVLGCVFALASKKKENLLVTGMFCGTLLIFFFPEYWFRRGYKQYAPFMAYIISFAIYSIYDKLKQFRIHKLPKFTMSFLIATFMLIAVIPTLDDPLYLACSRWNSPEYIAEYEYEAAEWIKNNLPENAVIVSDYRTMLLLNSLGNKIWITGKAMSAQSLGSEKSQQAIKTIKFEVFRANSSREAYLEIASLSSMFHIQEIYYLNYKGLKIDDLTFFVVLSSRTVAWIEQQEINDIETAQYSEVPLKYYTLFNDSTYFEPIYQFNNVFYIFKVKKQQYAN